MYELINTLQSMVTQCNRCELQHLPYSLQYYHVTNSGKLFLIIGEAPGEQETLTLQPFTGKSGMLLHQWLPIMGIDNYIISNMVKHRPPNNSTPTKEIINKCKQYLLMEEQVLKPDVYLLVGKTASTLLNIDLPVKTMVKQSLLQPYTYHDKPALTIYHPSFFLRNGKSVQDLTPLLTLYKKVILSL